MSSMVFSTDSLGLNPVFRLKKGTSPENNIYSEKVWLRYPVKGSAFYGCGKSSYKNFGFESDTTNWPNVLVPVPPGKWVDI